MPISPDTLLDEAKCLGCNSSASLSEMLKLALLQRIAESAQSGADGNPSLPLTSVQFNDAGAFGGDSDFTWNKTTNALSVAGSVVTPLVVGGSATTQDLSFKTTSGVGVAGADMHFLVGNNGATEAITVLNDGKVGIGTTGPLAKLHIASGSVFLDHTQSIRGGTSSTVYNGIEFYSGLTGNMIFNTQDTNKDFVFVTPTGGATELMRIKGTGKVGIGATTPTASLHIKAGSTTASTAPLKFTSGALLTAAEAGAVEFLTDDLYLTRTTGAVRSTVITDTKGRATDQVAANASILAHTVGAADASYEVSTNLLVTTSSAEAFTVTCDYTDEGNTARTITLPFALLAGTFTTAIAFANGAVPYEGVPLHIRCKASTTITIKTAAGGTYTGATYNVEGCIKRL